MGGCISTNSSQTSQIIYCKGCGQSILKYREKQHICMNKTVQKRQNNHLPILYINQLPNPDPIEISLYGNEVKKNVNQCIDKKVATNQQRTHFKWIKEEIYLYPKIIKQFSIEIIKNRTFQQKLLWFRLRMQQLRISWQKGCQIIKVSRGNILMSCFQQMKRINFHKQVKIKFDDEKVQDAGGLLKQYIHLTIKQLFSSQLGIFQLCDTHQTAYKIKWDKDIFQQLVLNYMWVLGVLIGKGIFQRISIDCKINKTIIRQLCSQPIHMHDVYSLDRKLYQSWKSILDNEGVQNLFLTFLQLKIHDDGTKQQIQLISNGRDIQVTDKNKREFISQLIHLHCTKSISKYLQQIYFGIEMIIPRTFLSIFQPHQFQMLMSGPSIINVQDWRTNTLYKGYKKDDKLIKQFWEIVNQYDQKQLSTLLHYCTGSTRVPILGFKYLQSNRNTVAKFTIQKQNYDKHNPYPKGHTCFNRLELPQYSQIQQMKQRLDIIIKQEVTHFGLD